MLITITKTKIGSVESAKLLAVVSDVILQNRLASRSEAVKELESVWKDNKTASNDNIYINGDYYTCLVGK